MHPDRLQEIFSRFREATVVVAGDFMLDEYVAGTAARISPEAPVPVVEVSAERMLPGGAGNVVRNLAVHTPGTIPLGVIGDDEAGGRLRRLFAEAGVDAGSLLSSPGRRTTVKTRVIAGKQQVLRFDRETRAPLSAAERSDLVERFEAALPRADAVILSDYGKGCLTPELLGRIVPMCRARRVPVLVDPKSADFSLYRGATVCTPNLKETEAAFGGPLRDDASLERGARELIARGGLDSLLVTRSERGMTLYRPDRPAFHVDARAREVFDVTGAGDTVIALLALGMAAGLAPEEAIPIANEAAGIVVGKIGAATATAEEILGSFRAACADESQAKVLPLPRLLERLAPLRAAGARVVFTNGVFDLLHVGHIRLFQRARALGDLLVVGLNSDASARAVKGPGRPILPAGERAAIIAAMGAVDFAVIFDEPTPEPLLERLRPDVLAKGSDYAEGEVVGADLVRRHGGRVERVRTEEGVSITRLLERLKELEEPRA